MFGSARRDNGRDNEAESAASRAPLVTGMSVAEDEDVVLATQPEEVHLPHSAAQEEADETDPAVLRQRIADLQCEVDELRAHLLDPSHAPPKLHPKLFSVHNRLPTRTSTLARCSSAATQGVMQRTPLPDADPMVLKIAGMFGSDVDVSYFRSPDFGRDVIRLSELVTEAFSKERRVLELKSPVYVFGDIHGNLRDLKFFSDHVWPLGLQLTAGSFLFLGDYVDRGSYSVEVLAYLFAHKLLYPHKLFLLRGNHETRLMNGWEEFYGSRCLLAQCKQRFGEQLGESLWDAANSALDCMPLAAVIDSTVFCVHGGIPRPRQDPTTGKDMRLQDIERIPVPAGLRPHYEHETEETIQLAVDMLWADPAAGSEDALGPDGFGEGPRGGGAISYGRKAVEDFLHEFNFSYIMRAHEPTATGIAVSKAARVITVFSTSRDHGMDNASCGCVLVERDCIFPINRLTSSALAKATASPPAAANPAAAAHRVRAAREDADEAAAAKAAAKAAAAKAAAAKDAATEASTQETETATEVEAADADDAPHAEEAEKFSATPARRRSWEAVSSPVDTPPAKRSRTQLSPFVTPMPAGSGSGRQPLSPRPEEAVDSQRRANLEALRAGFKRPRTFVLQPADVAACMPPPVLAAPTTSSATTAGPIATSPTAQAPAPSAFTRRMQTLAQQQQQPKRSFTGASDASCMSSQGAAVGEEHEQPQHKQQQHEQQQHGQQQHEQQSVATQDAEGWQE